MIIGHFYVYAVTGYVSGGLCREPYLYMLGTLFVFLEWWLVISAIIGL